MKSVYDSPLKILLQLTHLQETIAVGNKIENLLSRIAGLEALFATRPGNVEEQRRRSELIRYAVIPPLYSVLSSFQQA
jgi:hypothetical protein